MIHNKAWSLDNSHTVQPFPENTKHTDDHDQPTFAAWQVKQVGEPWVSFNSRGEMKNPGRCRSPASFCSDFCSCVGVSPLSSPRANKKRDGSRLSGQHRSHTHTHTHAGDSLQRRVRWIRHRRSVCKRDWELVGCSRGTAHDFCRWVGTWSWPHVSSFIYTTL